MPTYRSILKPVDDSRLLLQSSYSDDILANIANTKDKQQSMENSKEVELIKSQNSRYSKQFHKFKKDTARKFNILIVFVVFIFGSNIYILFNWNINKNAGNSGVVNGASSGQVSNISTKVQGNVAGNDENLKVINTFQNNPALIDLGFKVDIGKDYIANVADPNCQTPIVPPSVNGCGFAVLLSSMGVPDAGVAYKSLQIEAEFKDPEAKIQIDQKNYEKGSFTKTIAILDSTNFNNKIDLPVYIPTSEALFFRFWTKTGTIIIKRISIDYYSIDDLKKVTLKLGGENTNFKIASVYRDENENLKFEPKFDQKWVCTPYFPGVKDINADPKILTNIQIKLLRDDSCVISKKPIKWQDDAQAFALPPGKWLLVLDEKYYFPFEVTSTQNQNDIELNIAL